MKNSLWKTSLSAFATILIPLLYILNLLFIAGYSGTFFAPMSVEILGIVSALIGMSIWVITFFNLKGSFGVLPQKQKRVKKGLYKYFNHPMYVGIYYTFLGLSFANRSWQGLFFLTVIMTPLLVIRATLEDKKLS